MRQKRPMGHTTAGSVFDDAQYGGAVYGADELVIPLERDEAAIDDRAETFYGHRSITIRSLAELLLEYWSKVLQ
jgi:hypothetical protein